MSDELKTVKEIETSTVTLEGGCFDDTEESVVIASELRVEAVKWVKRIRNFTPIATYHMEACYAYGEVEFVDGSAQTIPLKQIEKLIELQHFKDSEDWIIHFFNLTEEELK